MNWKRKALLQNAVAHLPSGISYRLYYQLQKYFGRLRLAGPVETLTAGARFIRYLEDAGRSIDGATVLELGTGRQVNLPLAFWLAGAARILTLDKNPYLKEEMVLKDLAYMSRNRNEMLKILSGLLGDPVPQKRFDELLRFRGGLNDLLRMTNISYLAPADACSLSLPPQAIDFHVSFSVLQHIPPDTLRGILREGRRVLRKDGLFLAYVNMTDHFAHDDPSISLVNFLQFNDRAWDRLAGNKYMYQNRLRVDDVIRLFGQTGYRICIVEAKVDARSLQELEGGLPVDRKFAGKCARVNATSGAWIVAVPGPDDDAARLEEDAERICALLAASQTQQFHYPLAS